jgi:glycosyltransferase involved in cell wall biosynthesis
MDGVGTASRDLEAVSFDGEAEDVAILLSCWNGGPFIQDQLASFLDQTGVAWRLYWRDDASDDDTHARMTEFAAEHGRLVIDRNDGAGRIGITASFLALLRQTPPGRMVAFADQDDVWLPQKLRRGLTALSGVPASVPALYCARQILVDEQLRPLRESAAISGPPGFPQALTQNIATGCTVMLNPSAARLIAASRAPADTLHDWWSYLVVTAAGGRVLIDDEPTVLYRQHASNAVGVPLSPWRRAVAAVGRGPSVFMRTFRAHVDALQAQPHLLSAESREALALVAAGLHDGLVPRLRALAHPGLRRQNFAETQLFRLWFLLG